LDDITLASLQIAYARRKRFEARLQALQIVSVLGDAMAGTTGETTAARPGEQRYGVSASGRRYERTSANGLMAAMGARWAGS